MKYIHFAQYLVQTLLALIAAPVLRVTGYRFSKAWRGNGVINHVAANLWADGEPVVRVRFFNRFI
jgi:hypothetical protein